MRSEKARWRSEQLGEVREVELPQGTVRCHETGSGPTVVFVHGALVNANLWRNVIAGLQDRCRCVAIDMPLGSHLTPLQKDADLTPAGLGKLITDTIESLGLNDVVLVGNDTGGALCQVAVAAQPERIAGLVLTSCDAFDNFPPKAMRPMLPLMRPPGALRMLLAPMAVPAIRRRSATMMRVAKHRIPADAGDSYALPPLQDRGVRRDLKRAMAGMSPAATVEAAERFPEFDRPVLIAWSREDKFFPAAHAERLAESFPQARLEWIEDAYTLSPEDQPESLAAAIGEFMQASFPAGAA